MIKSLQFTTGFPTKFPHIGTKQYDFTPDLNVIFGQIGCGKSVIAKTLAAYSGIEKGGWSRISEPAKLASKTQNQFPWVYRQYTPNHLDAKVDWDGTPSFYYDSELMGKNDMTWFFQNASSSADGITTESEQMDILASKPSSGQYRVHKINQIMKLIQHPPNLAVIPPDIVTDRQYAAMEIAYIQGLSRDGKMTLILDEPERNLNLPKQLELFDVLDQLAKHFQVIAITHCPFILFRKGVNVIDLEDGYSDLCKKLVNDSVKGGKKKKEVVS